MRRIRQHFLIMVLLGSYIPLHAQTIVALNQPGHEKIEVINEKSLKSFKIKSLGEALKEVENQHNISIFYKSDLITDKVVSEPLSSGTLEEKLKEILSPNGLTYKTEDGKFYVVVPEKKVTGEKPAKPDNTTEPYNKDRIMLDKINRLNAALLKPIVQNISGRVVSEENNEPIPGVNIVAKGTTIGTISDVEGNYSLTVPDDVETLVFSYIGYNSQEVAIGGRTTINVQLTLNIAQLSEVVVVGYGTQERGVVTGAVSTVSMGDVRSLPLMNAEQALQGRVPGVMVTQTGGGAPGGAMQVNIRGIGSINGETPLYVIDGIPVQQGGQSVDGYSFLNSLNPNDIESMTVLKDASAAAIYGSRASGGVILITTKRGKEGPVRVTFDAYYGTQSQNRHYDVLNSDQYVDYLRRLHSGPDGQLPTGYVNGNPNPGVDTNWQEELFRTAPIQNYNIGLSGGNQNATFSIGLEYFDQQGTMIGTGFDRYSVRANSDFKIGKRIKVGETLLLSKTHKQLNSGIGGRRPIEHAIKQAPTVPVFDPSFLGGFGFPEPDQGQDASNPIATAYLHTNEQDRYRFWGSLYGELEIIPGLTYKLQLGMDMEYQSNFNFNPRYEGVRRNITPSSIGISRSENISPLVEQYLTFNRNFGKHNLTALAGWSAQSFTFESSGGTGENLPVGVISLEQAQSNRNLTYNKQESALRSLFGRVTYSYADRYLFTANIRRDESSKLFRATDPTGIFPSASVGWRVSEENFMQNVPFISDLKIRAGYGELGNQSVLGNYPVDVLFQADYFYVLGDQVVGGITQGELANRNITWEVTKQIDIGLDAGLFDNRLMVHFDYYNRKTEGVLWRRILAPSNGLGAPFVNGGEIENKGIELGLTYRKNEGDFRYDLNGNITTINNRVLSLVNPNLIIRQGGPTDDISNVSWTQVGQPIGMFYGFVHDGIFRNWDEVYSHAFINQATLGNDADGNPIYDSDKRDAETATTKTAPGDLKWRDINGDGVVNAEDQVALGNPIPKFTYGLTFNAAYRGFDFQFFLQGAHGHQIYNAAKRWLVDFRQNFNNGTEALNSTYYQPEYTASEARLVRADPNRNVLRSSDRYVFDGSYARIKNITLGYTFNNNLLNRIGANNIRVYGTVHNLATITNYFGLEPDIGSLSSTALQAGIDRLTYPQPRTFLVGVQVGF